MKIVLVQSRPYQAFAGGDGAYTSALVRHLDDQGHDVVGLTSGSTRGRPRPFIRLAYPEPRRARWRFRSTFRIGNTYVALGWQLVCDTLDFLRQRSAAALPDAVSPFAIPPDRHERAWIERAVRRERPDLVILTFEAVGAVDVVQRLATPLLALVGFLPGRSYALNHRSNGQTVGRAKELTEAMRRAGQVGFSSRDDCAFASSALGIPSPIYVGMGFAWQNMQSEGTGRVLLFVGNKTEPNREAIAWFVGQVWPLIRAAVPDARFRIVGRIGHYFMSDPASGIDCVGEVADLSVEYVAARAVVAPLMTGSAGVKTKVAEAISYGCPLVATSLGVDGGDATQIERAGFVADDPVQFTAAVVTLLTDDAAWRDKRAGTAAVFDQLFSREAAYGALDAFVARYRPPTATIP